MVLPIAAIAQLPGPTANVSVRVTELQSEATIEQVRVELLVFPDGILQMYLTDSSGRVEFFRLIPNRYTLRAIKDGYEITEVPLDIRRGESTKSAAIQMPRLAPRSADASGGVVSARALAIPDSARKEFASGVKWLQEQKDPRRSIPYFQRATEIFKGFYEAHYMLGMAYLQMKSASEGEASLKKSLEANPDYVAPYFPLASLLIGRKAYNEAEPLLLKALALDRQGSQAPFDLARCYAGRGDWSRALEYGLMAQERPNSPSKVHLLLADLYSNTGQRDKAIAELEKFSRLDPQSPYMPRVHQVLAELRLR